MKIAVINFSGNVGKTTISRHLLLPRIAGAELISVESLNADEDQGQSLRGRQFADLQEYMQTVDSLVVDIGASNVEDLMALMRRYHGSHEDFDYFVVPTVPELKQQEDTMATLRELSRSGIAPSRLKLVFNMVDDGVELAQAFDHLLAFLEMCPVAKVSPRCRLRTNEVYGRIAGRGVDLAALARDDTDYKALIAQAKSTEEKVALAQKLATRRLACGVVPELDACFAALELEPALA
jgi:hypothetical protein